MDEFMQVMIDRKAHDFLDWLCRPAIPSFYNAEEVKGYDGNGSYAGPMEEDSSRCEHDR